MEPPTPILGHAGRQSYYRNKSHGRLNDQLIPKPGDINMAEHMTKVAGPKEHPYASHISRFAVFPSFQSPDDPSVGVRAASQPLANPLVPAAAPDVALLRKTIGGPYRHEILETPARTMKKAVTWPGEHGFLHFTKPTRGETQVVYPTPPKMVMPNPKLRDWNLSLSERTCNMLKNLERTHWMTSYQMHYTGSGPANPLQIDDFKEKMSDPRSSALHSAPLRERSYPVFVPAKPRQGWKRRQGGHAGGHTCGPTAAELPSPSPAPHRGAASATVSRHGSPESTAQYNETLHPNKMGQSLSESSSGSAEAASPEVSHEVSHKQQPQSNGSARRGQRGENRKVQFDEILMQGSTSQKSQEANAAQIIDTKQPSDLRNHPLSQREGKVNRERSSIEQRKEPSNEEKYFKVGRNPCSWSQTSYQADIESHAELLSRAAPEQERVPGGRELESSVSKPCILPRPPVLPDIHPGDRTGTGGLSLLDLQSSFSKTEAHHDFNSSATRASVNLRDNVVTGKKHNFYGINSNILH